VNAFEQLLEFVSALRDAKVCFNLTSVRDAIMVTVVSPSTYYEIEFFADSRIEVQTFGPANRVQTFNLRDITDRVAREVNG
jgi:hypothetical protein